MHIEPLSHGWLQQCMVNRMVLSFAFSKPLDCPHLNVPQQQAHDLLCLSRERVQEIAHPR